MNDARSNPGHRTARDTPTTDSATGSRDAATIPHDQRSADGQADAGRTTGQVAVDTSVHCDDLATVRNRIGEVLHACDEDFIVDVQLVATELASNACDHADHPRHLLLRREVHPDRGPELVVEARDATPDHTPVVGSSSISPERGNGMRLVETICNDWGVRQEDRSKVVWARIPSP